MKTTSYTDLPPGPERQHRGGGLTVKTTSYTDLPHLARAAQVDIMFALVLGLILSVLLRGLLG